MARGRALSAAWRGAVATAALMLSSAVSAAQWTARVDEREGLPVVSRGGAVAVSSFFAFWSADWNWAPQRTEFAVLGSFDYRIRGTSRSLGYGLDGRIGRISSQALRWEFELSAGSATTGVIGGGIAFKFDLDNFGDALGEPELIPGNRGWRWGRASGDHIEMRFDPPVAAVRFEGRRKSEVRAFFYHGAVPRGTLRHTATLSVSGNAAIGPTRGERFGAGDASSWPVDSLDWRLPPVDLSFLNALERPAGKRGFLTAMDGALVFEDGTPARFWGTNVAANALFRTTAENVRQQARRLSALGFNLVRIHHHDAPWVNPNIFGERDAGHGGEPSPAMLAKLDWWIKCLRDEGIYVWLDLHVGRRLVQVDGIDALEEVGSRRRPGDLRGYNYVNSSIQRAMRQFNEAYVNHRNGYTGLRYKEDPAIAAMLITNENDLTNHFGNTLLPDKNVPRHSALYMAQAGAFAAASGLPVDRVWRSWEHGPSKIFLNDLERRFNAAMIAHLRALGVRVPIATTSTWGLNPMSSLPALTAGDIVDVHAYGDLGELEKNPLYAPTMVHWMAAAQVAGRPLSVTEWNVEEFLADDRHSIPLYVAAAARHQGWSALMHFAYAQSALNAAGKPSNWHAFNDPAMLASLPVAALLYRRGDVRAATTTYVYAPSKEQLFGREVSARNSAALRTAAEKGRLVIVLPQAKELPWLAETASPPDSKPVENPGHPLIDHDVAQAVSDTGELTRNWEHGTYVIDTPRTQAATGWIGGRSMRLGDVDIAVSTRHATVAIQSLDGKPIRTSREILVSLAARSVPQEAGQLPFRSEPVVGRIMIRAPEGLELYGNGNTGPAARGMRLPYEDGRYLVDLARRPGARWLVLR